MYITSATLQQHIRTQQKTKNSKQRKDNKSNAAATTTKTRRTRARTHTHTTKKQTTTTTTTQKAASKCNQLSTDPLPQNAINSRLSQCLKMQSK